MNLITIKQNRELIILSLLEMNQFFAKLTMYYAVFLRSYFNKRSIPRFNSQNNE